MTTLFVLNSIVRATASASHLSGTAQSVDNAREFNLTSRGLILKFEVKIWYQHKNVWSIWIWRNLPIWSVADMVYTILTLRTRYAFYLHILGVFTTGDGEQGHLQ